MNDTVLIDNNDTWVKITLNRPDRLNSLNVDLHLALRAALDLARQSRAVLITGAGRGFCAGQDLGERNPDSGDWPPDLGAMLRNYFNPLIRQISSLPVPVVCAVNGVAAGAGASLALACDVVLAAQSAKFIQAFSKIGLAPDAGASWLLPARVGQARALALALTGAPVTAKQAVDWGMIWECHDDLALMPAAEALVSKLAAGPTAAYAATKSLIWDAAGNSLSNQLDAEAVTQQALGQTADYAEGVRAFLAKRPAQFDGG